MWTRLRMFTRKTVGKNVLGVSICSILLIMLNWNSAWKSTSVKNITDVPFPALLTDYNNLLKALHDGGHWKPSPQRQPCDDKRKYSICVETNCTGPVVLNPSESLKSMLKSMEKLDLGTLREVTRLLRPMPTHKNVLFVTAASADHYLETQSLIQNLHEFVFPFLASYKLLFYDLGLTFQQRSELEQFCQCEVRTFPAAAMPPRLQNLRCYTWKPLIIHANLPTADTLIWVDSSVRFQNRTILKLLHHLDQTRLAVYTGMYSIAYHTQISMFDHFEEETCSFSHIIEPQAGFAGYKNDRFVREAVVKPWVTCALSPYCMCPEHAMSYSNCRNKVFRKYNHCHRYDQSALGIILTKLFRGHEVNFRIPGGIAGIRRGHGMNYFGKIKLQGNVTLFKDFR